MSPEERQLLTALFDRVATASVTPRDRDAENLIDEATRRQPHAAYYLAQAVIVQEKGLEAASNRIQQLEEYVRRLETETSEHHRAEQGGGFLSSIFGSGQPRQTAAIPSSSPSGAWDAAPRGGSRVSRNTDDGYRAQPASQAMAGSGGVSAAPSGPWSSQAMPSSGGSFLRGALGTAAGVAGGMLLANSLSGIFSSHANALGWGSPFSGANPFGNPAEPPVEETIINNNYFGDDAVREASSDSRSGDGGWQQADDDMADDQPDFDNSDMGSDDSMDV